jgi:cation:H+ antiporter
MNQIDLDHHHAVEVIGLAGPLAYVGVIYLKGSVTIIDGIILIAIYIAYLLMLSRMPPEDAESTEELDRIPRTIVKFPPVLRTLSIFGLFAIGGLIIYFTAEPFLGSLLAVSAALGIPSFVFVQWVAPFVSEFPEKISAFYWARTVDKAPMALMNMVSSNINQWTLLTAMLVIVYSWSRGQASSIVFDQQQSLELAMTLGQSVVGFLFLLNMQLKAWEASMLFALWFIQFAISGFAGAPGWFGQLAQHIHEYANWAYWIWAAIEVVRIILGKRQRSALAQFADIWRQHIIRSVPQS